jgi:hypothetical protein
MVEIISLQTKWIEMKQVFDRTYSSSQNLNKSLDIDWNAR